MKIAARWVKILKDIWSYRSRSILVVLSIAVGGASVGMITNAGHIIQRDLYRDYESVNPAHLQIYASPFPEQLAKSVEGMREVQAAQAQRTEEAWIFNDKDSLEEIQRMREQAMRDLVKDSMEVMTNPTSIVDKTTKNMKKMGEQIMEEGKIMSKSFNI